MANTSNHSAHAGRKWRWNLFVVSLLSSISVVGAFHFLPSAKVVQKATFSGKAFNLAMLPLDKQHDGGDKGRRIAEFMNLEPVTESATRKARLERDQETKERFAQFGDELWTLRKTMKKLGDKLSGALNGSSKVNEELIRSELRDAEARDPELVYEMELLEMELAQREGDVEQMEKSKQRALRARSCLPQFSLSGLWVGKYVG